MKTKIVSTKLYLLLIDEEAKITKNGEMVFTQQPLLNVPESSISKVVNIDKFNQDRWFKIIAYLPLQESATKLDLPLLPNTLITDIEQISWLKAKIIFFEKMDREPILEQDTDLLMVSCLQEGIMAGISMNSHKNYTIDNLRSAFNYYAHATTSQQPYNLIELNSEFNIFIETLSNTNSLFIPTNFIIKTTIIDEKVANEPYFEIIDGQMVQILVGEYTY